MFYLLQGAAALMQWQESAWLSLGEAAQWWLLTSNLLEALPAAEPHRRCVLHLKLFSPSVTESVYRDHKTPRLNPAPLNHHSCGVGSPGNKGWSADQDLEGKYSTSLL